jgi:hypothetical protein
MSALTGVGPSIASGNHDSSGNCADFPMMPANRQSDATICHGATEKLSSDVIENVPVFAQMIIRPIRKPASPILLKINAFFEAAAASGFCCQCPISMNDENPTNSQKTNISNKLSDKTMPSMANVKSPSIAKYRHDPESPAM